MLRVGLLMMFVFAITSVGYSQYQINGDASQISCNCYQLTQDIQSESGSVWNVNQIDLTSGFNYNFEVWLGCDEWGADGIAFVLQPINVNQGGQSSSLGYGGISPSLAIEVDIWPNDVTMSDPQDDHVAIMQNGNTDHASVDNLAGPVQASSTQVDIEDCQWHTVQIVWDPGLQTIAVFFDGVYRTSYTGDIINDIFGGDPNVYWGWTGSTGGASADQRFCNSILPGYTVTSTSACAGEQIDFEDASLTSSGNITNYSWDFGDGTTGTGAPVSHVYATGGTYDVTLEITTEGCTEDSIIPITIDPLPVVDLGPDIAICDGDFVQLNIPNNLGPGGTYAWTPSTDLSSTTIASPTASPTSSITYTLTYTDAVGCSGSDEVLVTVNPLPMADAGENQIICEGEQANLLASGGVSYSWTPATSLSNAAIVDPTATPIISTVYTVTVTDANNCSNIDNVAINVVSAPPIDAGSDEEICDAESVQLNAVGTGSYNWSPAASLNSQILQNPTAQPSVTTMYYVTLTDLNNCSATDSVQVTVNPIPVVDLGSDISLCDGETVQLNNPNTMGSGTYTWSPATDLSNATAPSPTTTPVSSITYSLTFTDNTNCSGTDDVQVMVNPLPVADAGQDQTMCEGEQANLQASGGVSYSWTPAGTLDDELVSDPVATPVVTTTYTVSVTDVNNCSDTDDLEVDVVSAPAIDAGQDQNICEGDVAQLNAVGVGTFSWAPAGSLDNSSVQNPVASPVTTTVYYITLTDANNCSATDSLTIDVDAVPVADFPDPTPVCNGTPIQFADNSTGNIVSYDWDFGDLEVGTGANPTHVYPGIGVYNVELTVTSANGCTSTTIGVAEVITGPVAAFSITGGTDLCEQQQLIFQNSSSGPIATYFWDFGDFSGVPAIPNSNSSEFEPAFSFPHFGDYTVTLIVATADGCSNFVQHQVSIHPIPFAEFAAAPACFGETTEFTDFTTIPVGSVSNWQWNFGDASTGNSQNATHTYNTNGAYNVVLIAQSAIGCMDTIEHAVYVNPTPVVSISANDVCFGDGVSFTNGTTPNDNTITQWDWTFGDGQTADTFQPNHDYLNHGVYSVQLTAITDSSCEATTTLEVEVYPYPVPDFSYSDVEGCSPFVVDFEDESSIAQGYSIGSYEWDFGDGSTSDVASPSYSYGTEGIYDVSLVLTTEGGGCTDTATVESLITVYVTPHASFSFGPTDATLLDPRIFFTNHSQDGVVYDWDFGDGFISDEVNPMHAYSLDGDYLVTLIVANGICSDRTTQTVHIDPETFVYIPNAITPNGDGKNDKFIPQGIGIETFDMAIFDRWGKELFYTANIEKPWDGTHLGYAVPVGTYVYRINIVNVKGEADSYMGHVNVLR